MGGCWRLDWTRWIPAGHQAVGGAIFTKNKPKNPEKAGRKLVLFFFPSFFCAEPSRVNIWTRLPSSLESTTSTLCSSSADSRCALSVVLRLFYQSVLLCSV